MDVMVALLFIITDWEIINKDHPLVEIQWMTGWKQHHTFSHVSWIYKWKNCTVKAISLSLSHTHVHISLSCPPYLKWFILSLFPSTILKMLKLHYFYMWMNNRRRMWSIIVFINFYLYSFTGNTHNSVQQHFTEKGVRGGGHMEKRRAIPLIDHVGHWYGFLFHVRSTSFASNYSDRLRVGSPKSASSTPSRTGAILFWLFLRIGTNNAYNNNNNNTWAARQKWQFLRQKFWRSKKRIEFYKFYCCWSRTDGRTDGRVGSTSNGWK